MKKVLTFLSFTLIGVQQYAMEMEEKQVLAPVYHIQNASKNNTGIGMEESQSGITIKLDYDGIVIIGETRSEMW